MSSDHLEGLASLSMDRRQAVLQVVHAFLVAGRFGRSGSFDRAALILTNVDYLRAKVAVGQTLDLAGELEEAYRECSRRSRRRLEDAMVAMVVEDEDREGGSFRLQNLHSWFGWHGTRDFYVAVLRAVEERIRRDHRRRALARKALKYSMIVARQDERVREAHAGFRRLLRELRASRPPDYAEIGRIEYELGMTHNLLGQAKLSVATFQRGVEDSIRGGDVIGSKMSEARKVVTELLCGLIEPSTAIAELERMRRGFMDDQQGHPMAEGWITNTTLHLCDAAYEAADPELLARYIGQLKEDPVAMRMRSEPSIRTGFLARDARLALLVEDWNGALQCFAPCLQVDLKRWGEQDEALLKWAERREALSREYLLAGIALENLGQVERAREVWARGLQCPDEMANQRWKRILLTKCGSHTRRRRN